METVKEILTTVKQSLKGEQQDYTQGSIPKAVFLLGIPMILELSLESVFALVDMFFVGKLGQNAIATVGLTESVFLQARLYSFFHKMNPSYGMALNHYRSSGRALFFMG